MPLTDLANFAAATQWPCVLDYFAHKYNGSIDLNLDDKHNKKGLATIMQQFGANIESITLTKRFECVRKDDNKILNCIAKYCGNKLSVLKLNGFSFNMYLRDENNGSKIGQMMSNVKVFTVTNGWLQNCGILFKHGQASVEELCIENTGIDRLTTDDFAQNYPKLRKLTLICKKINGADAKLKRFSIDNLINDPIWRLAKTNSAATTLSNVKSIHFQWPCLWVDLGIPFAQFKMLEHLDLGCTDQKNLMDTNMMVKDIKNCSKATLQFIELNQLRIPQMFLKRMTRFKNLKWYIFDHCYGFSYGGAVENVWLILSRKSGDGMAEKLCQIWSGTANEVIDGIWSSIYMAIKKPLKDEERCERFIKELQRMGVGIPNIFKN